MIDSKKYYENTKKCEPHHIVKKFIKLNIEPENAIDLGCGAGRDTIYLIKNGWNVLGIDKENVEEIITEELEKEEKVKFRFENQKFENIELEPSKLLTSNFALSFCNTNYFYDFWEKIVNSIKENRIFRWKLLWN